MATYTRSNNAIPGNTAFDDVAQWNVSSSTLPTTLTLLNADGTLTRLTGSGFALTGTTPTAGNVTQIHRFASNGTTLLETITAINLTLVSIFTNIADLGNFIMNGPDSVTGGTLGDGLKGFGNADTISGGGGNDSINAGGGADSVDGGSGNDNIQGRNGNDTINGGTGFDEVRYDQDAANGGPGPVVVNLSTGLATDGFGATDTLISIELVRGTQLADSLTGGNASSDDFEGFRGLNGNDTINGGTGFDEARYDLDNTNGGTGAILANLLTGQITDGFGATDTVINIEAVRGTQFADQFIGNESRNFFAGMAGNDTLNGGSGDDEARYHQDADLGGTGAVTVNLITGLATDGFGNTDTLISIEDVRGTDLGDSITGNGADNFLRGEGGNDTLIGNDGFDFFEPGAGDDSVNGNPGSLPEGSYADIDALSYEDDVGTPININLSNTTVIDPYGNTDTFSDIERIFATAGNDTITGSTTQNLDHESFGGLAGNDVINGSNGTDYAYYFRDASLGGTAGVVVDLAAGTATDGFGNTDTLSFIEGVFGTNAGDNLAGDSNDNWFRTYAGNDTVNGRDGFDTIDMQTTIDAAAIGVGGAIVNLATNSATSIDGHTIQLASIEAAEGSYGNDIINGNDLFNLLGGDFGNDSINAGNGDDLVNGGAGNDTLIGGVGIDFVSYRYDPAFPAYYGFAWTSATVNLATGVAQDGRGGTDQISQFENVAGTYFNDSITGDGNDNAFYGMAGNDTLNGAGGSDTAIYAVWDGLGTTSFGHDGVEIDVPNGIVVDLAAQVATNDGHGNTDQLIGIENIIGSIGNDSIAGDIGANLLSGLQGNDTFAGRGGDDTIDGDEGTDTALYASQRSQYNIQTVNDGVGNLNTIVRHATNLEGTDTLITIERLSFTDGTFSSFGANLNKTSNVVGSRFDDVVFHNAAQGRSIAHTFADGARVGQLGLTGVNGPQWQAIDSGYMNGDGTADVVYQNVNNGTIAIGLMGNRGVGQYSYVTESLSAQWRLVGVADIDGDAYNDLVIQNNATGAVYFGDMTATPTGVTFGGWNPLSGLGTAWQVRALGDINGDGTADVIYQNTANGAVSAGLTTTNGIVSGFTNLGAGAGWTVREAGDANKDGFADVFYQNNLSGDIIYRNMANGQPGNFNLVLNGYGTAWRLDGLADTNNDGDVDAIIRNTLGSSDTYVANIENGTFQSFSLVVLGAGADWYVV